jgi:hypothetical protein
VLSKAWIPAFAGTTFIWLALLLSINGHAADGLPDLTTADGGRYYGSLRDGKPNGRGRVEWDNGALYEGNFQDGVYEGRGRFVGPDGRRYEGEFANGLFDGRGRFESPNGELYEGDFEKGEFTGYGTWSRPDGARYRGTFLKGRMHGEGRYSDGQGEVYEGEFVDGVFKPLIAQRKLLEAQLAGIERGRPGTIELYLLAVGGDGTQEVFRREVEFVQQAFDQRFGTRGRSLGLANGKSTSLPMASVATIGEALGTLAERMDRDEDILFLFLTSHGTPTHELKLQQPGFALRDLPAPELGRMLRTSGIRWKVVVVSACYSGGFIDALRDDSTLIITAARYDRSSFGCTDGADFTYFGRAFFKEALPASRSFQDAFSRADRLVAEWERKDLPKEPRSLPQLRSAPAIDAQLARWAAQQR